MPGLALQTEACVLLKRPPSEKFHLLTVFSAEHGALTVMQRLAQKAPATSVTLDLFDDAALALASSNQGQTWFVQEARVLVRRSAIGRSYDALRLAVAFTTLVARNPVPQESRAQVAALPAALQPTEIAVDAAELAAALDRFASTTPA